MGATSYIHYSYNLTAASNSTTLMFSFVNPSSFTDLDDVSVTALTAPVPEPETWALMGLGLIAVAARRRRAAKHS